MAETIRNAVAVTIMTPFEWESLQPHVAGPLMWSYLLVSALVVLHAGRRVNSLRIPFVNPHEDRGIGPLLEDVGKKFGRSSIGLGHAGIRSGLDWTMKRGMRSPRYTTHWDELPLVKAA